MPTNIRNFGVAIGRLAQDPVVFDNSDGSKKVKLKLAIQDNYKSGPDNTKQTRFVEFDAFVSADKATKSGLGVYGMIHKGDLVGLNYTLQPNTYEKGGETVYVTNLMVQSVDMMESKTVTAARAAKNAAAGEAEGDAPAAAPEGETGVADDAPFGD